MSKGLDYLIQDQIPSLKAEEREALYLEINFLNLKRIRAIAWYVALFVPALTYLESRNLWPKDPALLPFPVQLLAIQVLFTPASLFYLYATRQVNQPEDIRPKHIGAIRFLIWFCVLLNSLLCGMTQPTQPGLERYLSLLLILSSFLYLRPKARMAYMGTGYLLMAGAMFWVIPHSERLPVLLFTAAFWTLIGQVIMKVNYDSRAQIFLQDRQLNRQQKELTNQRDAMERLSYVDGLTNVPNRRYFDDAIELEWRRASREVTPLSLIMVDIDYFKRFNDRYQHQAGDLCLKEVARVMAETAKRPGDVVARYGGEEFAIILPGTDLSGAEAIAQRLRHAVLGLNIKHEDSPHGRVTVSLGIAQVAFPNPGSPASLLAKADRALYEAKEEGRNRIGVAGG